MLAVFYSTMHLPFWMMLCLTLILVSVIGMPLLITQLREGDVRLLPQILVIVGFIADLYAVNVDVYGANDTQALVARFTLFFICLWLSLGCWSSALVLACTTHTRETTNDLRHNSRSDDIRVLRGDLLYHHTNQYEPPPKPKLRRFQSVNAQDFKRAVSPLARRGPAVPYAASPLACSTG